MALVEVENLTHSFGSVKALDDLTISVEEGEIFGLIGPDGAGKTTFLRILCGLIPPTSGKVMVLGIDVARDPEAIKTDIGYMAQPAKLYDDLSIRENIELYADLYHVPRSQYRERMARLLEFSGLGPFTGRLFRNLSGGMKQKVGLTCALIHTPRLLFLDEPTNGVDPVSRRDFWKILYELRRERVTIIVSSTYLDEADRCHRIALFDRGRARLVMEPTAIRGLGSKIMYHLVVNDRRRALNILTDRYQAARPTIFGAGIHISLDHEEELPRITESIEQAGIDVMSATRIQPHLEDVYLSLVKEDA